MHQTNEKVKVFEIEDKQEPLQMELTSLIDKKMKKSRNSAEKNSEQLLQKSLQICRNKFYKEALTRSEREAKLEPHHLMKTDNSRDT